MRWLPALSVLVVTALGLHPLVALLVPDVARRWSMGWILLWVLWGTLVVPLVITAWSRVLAARIARHLAAQLDAWRARGAPFDAALGALLREALEEDQHAVVREVLRTLGGRREDARVEALCSAGHAWLEAADFGSGAFHADGWASLSLQERRAAFVSELGKV